MPTVSRATCLLESVEDLIYAAQFNRRMVVDHYLSSSDGSLSEVDSEAIGRLLVTLAMEQHYVFNLIDAIRTGSTDQAALLTAIPCPTMNELIGEDDGFGDTYEDE